MNGSEIFHSCVKHATVKKIPMYYFQIEELMKLPTHTLPTA